MRYPNHDPTPRLEFFAELDELKNVHGPVKAQDYGAIKVTLEVNPELKRAMSLWLAQWKRAHRIR